MSAKMSALCELSQKELISKNNELKGEKSLLKDENCLLKTELNEYKNDSKKRQKSSGSEALDRQTVDKRSHSVIVFAMICRKFCFNFCRLKTNSDFNVCANSSRGLFFRNRINSISISRVGKTTKSIWETKT